jgi:hypothetical protein
MPQTFNEKIEKIDVGKMQPFPDGSVWDSINLANKINEIIDFINSKNNKDE